jgi:hypothetical protein
MKTLILDNGAYEVKTGFVGTKAVYLFPYTILTKAPYRIASPAQKEIVASTLANNCGIAKTTAHWDSKGPSTK